MLTRTLGRSGVEVSAIGMGCWAIGGANWREGKPVGWGAVDDAESIRAIHAALEMGVTLFDTADVYGSGHSERVLAKALAGRRDEVVIASKVGYTYEEATRQAPGECAEPDYIRRSCDASLDRLNTDRIDLYQFHLGGHDLGAAAKVRDVMEELVAAGKVRWYGWSTDDAARARLFAEGPHCTAIQQRLNIFGGNAETLAVCEELNLASLNRGPLGMGLLTGKFTADTKLPDDDVRHGWDFRQGAQAGQLARLDALRDVLTSGGRTLAQGALCWLLARSDKTLPIPGFKTVAQVRENAAAAGFGPLSPEQMAQIDGILAKTS